MVSQSNEQAPEASNEKALSGIRREALKDQIGHGYPLCWSSDDDREFAINKIRGMRA